MTTNRERELLAENRGLKNKLATLALKATRAQAECNKGLAENRRLKAEFQELEADLAELRRLCVAAGLVE